MKKKDTLLKRFIDVLFVLALVLTGVIYFGYFKFIHPQSEELLLKDFAPMSTLVQEENKVSRAKFPVFDAHIHLEYSGLSIEDVLKVMEECNVYKIVDLETHGLFGDKFKEHRAKYGQKAPDKLISVANLDYSNIDAPDYAQKVVAQLERDYENGARALKIWRDLGVKVRDGSGKLLRLDDPRFDGVWKKAAALKMPVIMHNADPTAFWKPVDEKNERFEELQARVTYRGEQWGKYGPLFDALTGTYFKASLMRHPKRLFYDSAFNWDGTYFPAKDEILSMRQNIMKKHPETLFIGAHMGYSGDNLDYLAQELDAHPNYMVELSHVVPELGRQPYTARDFFIKYQDRIIFGLDGAPEADAYRASFRFLETFDEYFDYPRANWNLFGRWKIFGIGLPDNVLKKIYNENAERIYNSYRAAD